MKYEKDWRWETATKNNTPHFYLYLWIRFSSFFALLVNSIIMFVITNGWNAFDRFIEVKIYCVITIVLALGGLFLIDTPTKIDFVFVHVFWDLFFVVLMSSFYITDNWGMILLHIVEIGIIIYFGIKIEKDNSIVENNKFVLWWKWKKQEKYERELKKWQEEIKSRCVKVELTEEQKLKKMSRKERKKYKEKKAGRN